MTRPKSDNQYRKMCARMPADRRAALREALSPNPYASRAHVLAAAGLKGGNTQVQLAAVRFVDFGIKLGPGGMVRQAPAQNGSNEVPNGASPQPTGKLRELLQQIQSEMRALGVEELRVPANGKATIRQMVEREL